MRPSDLRQTHTVAELEVSAAAYDEIADKLRAAEYDHAFMPCGMIDMTGIGLTRETLTTAQAQHRLDSMFLRREAPLGDRAPAVEMQGAPLTVDWAAAFPEIKAPVLPPVDFALQHDHPDNHDRGNQDQRDERVWPSSRVPLVVLALGMALVVAFAIVWPDVLIWLHEHPGFSLRSGLAAFFHLDH